ncbi:MAG: 3-dehydroquinate synthase [Natronincolaceae bacterium]|jgi:3-dehydroquinate synthase|nr:3-dehydroquinate synthase [Bacillota bacterium]NLK90398.1 3-dehydroquinate synthase [Clostridiales bacterium]
MEKVRVNLKENSYNILIGKGLLGDLENLAEHSPEQNFIITDKNINALYGNYLDALDSYERIVIEPGEQSKSIDVTANILKQMLEKGASRRSKVIAFGGGVVGDLAGFCSAIYMRGIPFVQIPTTLLAQVDSSVGGKTGINLLHYKNSIGAFHQPVKVIIDTGLLHTLPYKELLSGIGEIIKYGIIYDYEFFKYVARNIEKIKKCDEDIMPYVVKRCCEIKAEIVSRDEKEEGLRKILNFGHTIGHALEGITDFSKYAHGEAVIIGMYYETIMAKKMGIVDEEYAAEILNFLDGLGIDLNIDDYPVLELADWMLKDKKNVGGKISFILPVKEGMVKEQMLEKSGVLYYISSL